MNHKTLELYKTPQRGHEAYLQTSFRSFAADSEISFMGRNFLRCANSRSAVAQRKKKRCMHKSIYCNYKFRIKVVTSSGESRGEGSSK